MTSTTTNRASSGTRYAFCPSWCINDHSDDFALDVQSGLPVIVHVSEHAMPSGPGAGWSAWIARDDLVEAGEGVRIGEAHIGVTSDVSDRDLTPERAREVGAQLIALADALDATEDHR